ncbi:deoxynucleoside triphosphate triphosphohydrolase SAMHD1-like isoform X3 [Ctenopharyngodon idella]|uniref:deoxynucleoside triphosphate triphosphohydrolase SAMHD1-like isoform X3 n=1 Tax=Ctenopharyngodon idella TaxID=7959 RepID=UPI002231CCFF|nr:deoxynucleoside triphosphate triphosphohydrolase SAMHD1-like isoform X3 [Ctenopharyngodon idella]
MSDEKTFDKTVEKIKTLFQTTETVTESEAAGPSVPTAAAARSVFEDPTVRKKKINGELQIIAEKYSLKLPTDVKVVNDSVHGHIELHPLLVKIIDTPQFQRLRDIKQLGAGYWVFPGASHNRFEHSIGVAHLAGCLVKSLQEKQPELNINNRDVLCVQIAGLCHDLGHGPFSHLFDLLFIPAVKPDSKWKHEKASVKMFEHLVKENGLQQLMEAYGLKFKTDQNENDLVFIGELIKGVDKDKKDRDGNLKKGWLAEGRTEDKAFLYEIVSNERNKIDVDKWDYFARDCHHLGISKSFDHQRLLKFARVCEVEIKDEAQKPRQSICYRDKEAGNIFDMFRTRYTLHRQAYQHKTVNIIEIMIKEALVKADGHFQISEAIKAMKEYTKLTDQILEKILYSEYDQEKDLQDAREIVMKILKRDLPKFLGEAKLEKRDQSKVEGDWTAAVEKWNKEKKQDLKVDDFVVDVVCIDHGMKDKNPMDNVYFYRKRDPDIAFLITDQMFLPKDFYEELFRVYYKGPEEKLKEAQQCFDEWSREYFKPMPKCLILVYDKDEFGGNECFITGDCPSLDRCGIDVVRSCKVIKGIWKLYDGQEYKEPHYLLKEGDYPNPAAWGATNPAKSLKSVTFQIQLYEQVDLVNPKHETTVDCPSVEEQFGINGVRSCKVVSGVWELYEGRDYTEPHYLLNEGEYPNPAAWGATNPAQSLNRVTSFKIQLFERENFEDPMHEITVDCSSVEDQFGIKAVRSCKVVSGIWRLFEDPDYTKPHYLLKEGEYPNPAAWGATNPAQSLKRVTE